MAENHRGLRAQGYRTAGLGPRPVACRTRPLAHSLDPERFQIVAKVDDGSCHHEATLRVSADLPLRLSSETLKVMFQVDHKPRRKLWVLYLAVVGHLENLVEVEEARELGPYRSNYSGRRAYL